MDVLFLRAERQMCNLLALSTAASLRLAKSETRFSSGFVGACQKAEQFYTFQCMRDLKSIAHKLHTWPRYFTLNPRYTYCFARRGFSRNKTDSFALPEKKCFSILLVSPLRFLVGNNFACTPGGDGQRGWWDESE